MEEEKRIVIIRNRVINVFRELNYIFIIFVTVSIYYIKKIYRYLTYKSTYTVSFLFSNLIQI